MLLVGRHFKASWGGRLGGVKLTVNTHECGDAHVAAPVGSGRQPVGYTKDLMVWARHEVNNTSGNGGEAAALVIDVLLRSVAARDSARKMVRRGVLTVEVLSR